MTKRLSWAIRIERAEKRGKFTEQEHNWSTEWMTCAVGEKHNFPRTDDYVEHVDDTEIDLGVLFMRKVLDNNIPEAKRIYAEIQAL